MKQMASIAFVEVALSEIDWQCDTDVELDFHLDDAEEEIWSSDFFVHNSIESVSKSMKKNN